MAALRLHGQLVKGKSNHAPGQHLECPDKVPIKRKIAVHSRLVIVISNRKWNHGQAVGGDGLRNQAFVEHAMLVRFYEVYHRFANASVVSVIHVLHSDDHKVRDVH